MNNTRNSENTNVYQQTYAPRSNLKKKRPRPVLGHPEALDVVPESRVMKTCGFYALNKKTDYQIMNLYTILMMFKYDILKPYDFVWASNFTTVSPMINIIIHYQKTCQ